MVVDRLPCTENITVDIEVANTGKVDGGHVVMVYSKSPSEVIGAPAKQLVAFQRMKVPARKTAVVEFEFNVCKAFSIVEKTACTVLPAGRSLVLVGDNDCGVSFPVQINLIY
ncbi:putative beta-D-xylosidase 6 [Apostasia shenzhenica]|uniref:Putative beta-D-xylosidase 6 n=1 Tax=Apostasia shenzhenica TaxID=1088818 RepID=A0A2I0AI11_9ASPA|nr:putative beta-D-xylosidase 6 [Apostasia shenzhenica]